MNLLQIFVFISGSVITILFLFSALVSLKENEPRAAKRFLATGLLLSAPYFLSFLLNTPVSSFAATGLFLVTILTALTLLLPIRRKHQETDDTPKSRLDERDTMFSRNALRPGSQFFEEYYRKNPDKKENDDYFREKPGLLGKQAKFYDPVQFAAAEASFITVKAFHPLLDQSASTLKQVSQDPKKISEFIKQWAVKLGAHSAGITFLRDYHLYTHVGRGRGYGKPVTLNHRFAIALTVEMDKQMLDRAPFGPTVMESAQQYLNSGAIAVQIAEFIKQLGYPARAHIDGNYRVVCPLIARDAGLGEIGRMGLLMTPDLGPRVRISVITTDLPLIPDERKHDRSMFDFCSLCKKCARVCPSKAIPDGDRQEIQGVSRWQINSETCFDYWCQVGTDCARCVRVCPYAHPDNFLHNTVRRLIKNSFIFQHVAAWLDDFFYGKKPLPSKIPEWLNFFER